MDAAIAKSKLAVGCGAIAFIVAPSGDASAVVFVSAAGAVIVKILASGFALPSASTCGSGANNAKLAIPEDALAVALVAISGELTCITGVGSGISTTVS